MQYTTATCTCGHRRIWHAFLRGVCEFHEGRGTPPCGCERFAMQEPELQGG